MQMIPLSDDDRHFVEAQVNSGGYASELEFIAHLVHEERRRQTRAEIEALLEGLNSPSSVLTDADWNAMRQEARERLAAERARQVENADPLAKGFS